MNFLTGLAVYFVIWWISLFIVLPWGNKPEEKVIIGNEKSAPAKPRILVKFLITTLLAAFIWFCLWLVIYFKIFKIIE